MARGQATVRQEIIGPKGDPIKVRTDLDHIGAVLDTLPETQGVE